jgi:hypothetical protein
VERREREGVRDALRSRDDSAGVPRRSRPRGVSRLGRASTAHAGRVPPGQARDRARGRRDHGLQRRREARRGNIDIAEIAKATQVDPGWQKEIAWHLVGSRDASSNDIALAVALAHEAVAADGGLDFSLLDTYSLALSKANLPGEAATVSWRVLAICALVHAECMVERRRAYAYIYYAREKGFKSRRW